MRTIEAIKKEMTDAVLENETLRQAFGLNQSEEWGEQVSSVSILNLLIYIVAVSVHTLEWLFDQFKEDVEERIAAALPGTVSWYWNKVMEFQEGYELNENARYDEIDLESRIVKYCSVTEVDNGIIVKVNGEGYSQFNPRQLQSLQAYVDTVKFAGTTAAVFSYEPDTLDIELNIWRDPMLLDANMFSIQSGENEIRTAIEGYLNGIKYGGVFNKTKLIDAVQQVEGVLDVTIEDGTIWCNGDGSYHGFEDFEQNFRSYGGHFNLEELITYDKISE